MSASFSPSAFSGKEMPTISGMTRIYKKFRVRKCVIDVLVTVTFNSSSSLLVSHRVKHVDASDLTLVSAITGQNICFSNIENNDNALNTINGISWPISEPGTDVSIVFGIRPSILAQEVVRKRPRGCDVTSSIKVNIRISLFGAEL